MPKLKGVLFLCFSRKCLSCSLAGWFMVGTLLSPDLAPMVISGQATQFKKKKIITGAPFCGGGC